MMRVTTKTRWSDCGGTVHRLVQGRRVGHPRSEFPFESAGAIRKLTKLTPAYGRKKHGRTSPSEKAENGIGFINEKEPGALRLGSLPGSEGVGQSGSELCPPWFSVFADRCSWTPLRGG